MFNSNKKSGLKSKLKNLFNRKNRKNSSKSHSMKNNPKQDKKPLKDKLSKIGNFLKTKGLPAAAKVLDVVDNVYPPAGVVTNLLETVSGDLPTKDVVELNRLADDYKAELELHLENTKSAREMYVSTDHETADFIATKVIKENLFILLGLVLVQAAVVIFIQGQVAAIITSVVGTITGALINERSTVINFFFGSSTGSKEKDKLINK